MIFGVGRVEFGRLSQNSLLAWLVFQLFFFLCLWGAAEVARVTSFPRNVVKDKGCRLTTTGCRLSGPVTNTGPILGVGVLNSVGQLLCRRLECVASGFFEKKGEF